MVKVNFLLFLAVVCLFALNTNGGAATLDTVGGLAEACRNVEAAPDPHPTFPEVCLKSEQAFACMGFFKGLDEYQNIRVHYAKSSPFIPFESLYCLPRGVSYEQMVKVFLKWAEEHPEKLHMRAADAVLAALVRAFPCKGHETK